MNDVPDTCSDDHPSRSGWHRGRLIACAVIVVLSIVWLGCSVREHYETLSFFFDGVPDPGQISDDPMNVAFAKQTGGTYYVHQPYKENRCRECHGSDSNVRVTRRSGDMCMKCHADVAGEHSLMHGPVAAEACLWCHAPHESTLKPLLRKSAPQLCMQCHTEPLMRAMPNPAHNDLTRSCLDCHYGHGGEQPHFLKNAWDSNGADAAENDSVGSDAS